MTSHLVSTQKRSWSSGVSKFVKLPILRIKKLAIHRDMFNKPSGNRVRIRIKLQNDDVTFGFGTKTKLGVLGFEICKTFNIAYSKTKKAIEKCSTTKSQET